VSRLALRGIHRRYGGVVALEDVALVAASGSRTAILGPSGSGKSTLLRLIAGFDAPDAGTITLGEDVLAEGPRAVPAHLRGIGLVAQEGALFPHLDVAANIGFGLPRDAPDRQKRIAALLEMVGLEPAMARRQPDQLSGGQQQRVALARALARSPRLMLLDEPFSALDTGLRASTRKAVAELLGAAGITTVLVTHDQAEALSFADQVVVMREGRVLQAGPPRELYLRPRDATVAAFLGEAILLPAVASGGWADCAAGRVPVHDAAWTGAARLMLRPEQVSLATHGPGPLVHVEAVEFGGAACSVTVRLPPGVEGPAPRLSLRASALFLPPVGAWLYLSVAGEGHLLPA